MGKSWYFGQVSDSDKRGFQFWKMDLEGNTVIDSLWKHIQPRCQALAASDLRVVRQYANGQTYGVGGEPHVDDVRAGCYTLLYYPMEEWKSEWDGETVFYDERGEVILAVVPRPNRAVFFDARIRHVGRAPSRSCAALRVTLAYKVEATAWEDLRHLARAKKALRSPE